MITEKLVPYTGTFKMHPAYTICRYIFVLFSYGVAWTLTCCLLIYVVVRGVLKVIRPNNWTDFLEDETHPLSIFLADVGNAMLVWDMKLEDKLL